jgi:hypothetical protein
MLLAYLHRILKYFLYFLKEAFYSKPMNFWPYDAEIFYQFFNDYNSWH